VDVDIIDIVDVATDKLDKTIDKFRCNLDNDQPSFNNNLNQEIPLLLPDPCNINIRQEHRSIIA
jgi:hypothetical protein